ncbi:DUF2188 domain-containing protein [Paenibacillus xerothermodurans]|uniref:DUF2188 domain-containing protein n=1 Tax=Paenibacillus xerothermodurans TaxID=1977292 RepID=A0A2W1NZ83_PAEXE|nr:DUF2188 domain-containing protein [Paenibacillus xerothermodurans]PZE20158.1 DUF2188 domain-containing protein [Paenibacillus xerothermodurans]
MPWNKNDYPVSMKNLEPRVRDKAIEIANALLGDGYDEGRAIAIATAKAKEWDEDHPRHEPSSNKPQAVTGGSRIHVVPNGDGWAVKEEGQKPARFKAETKAEAVESAKKWASDANTSAIVHRKDGTVETSHNYS